MDISNTINGSASSFEESCSTCAASRRAAEHAQQELHEARRSYNTALQVQQHLAAELEAANGDNERRVASVRAELATVKESLIAARTDRDQALAQLDTAQRELRETRERLREAVKEASPRVVSPPPASPPHARVAVVEPAEVPSEALRAAEGEAARWRAEAESLVEQLTQVREAAGDSRAALAAAAEREEELVAATVVMRAQLHALDSDVEHAAKGNSLFAEVDDKRQEMAKSLLQMKRKNTQLKSELGSVRAELEALQLEKKTVWEQFASEASHHDQILIESYMERVSVLESCVEQARRAGAGAAAAGAGAGGAADRQRLTAALLATSVAELKAARELRELRRKWSTMVAGSERSQCTGCRQSLENGEK